MENLHHRIRSTAEKLSGGPLDVPERAALLRDIFHHSGGAHRFPLLGAHGAMWGHRFLEHAEQASRLLGLGVGPFCRGMRDLGRRIFVDVYTHYHFSRLQGERPGAEDFINPSLLEPLNRLHAARKGGGSVDEVTRHTLYRESLLWEQKQTVTSGVFDEFERLGTGPFWRLARRPVVRFQFFSPTDALWFSDFTNRDERVEKAIKTYRIAERVGWGRVEATLVHYRALPRVRTPVGAWQAAGRMFNTVS